MEEATARKFYSRLRGRAQEGLESIRMREFRCFHFHCNLFVCRPSDRTRGMAVAKAQSQKRLMMQPKRCGHEISVCICSCRLRVYLGGGVRELGRT